MIVFVALVGVVVRPAKKKLCTRFLFETVSSLVSVFGADIISLPSLRNRPSTGTLLAGVLFIKRSFGAGLFVAFFVLACLWVMVSLGVGIDVRIWSVEWTKGSPWKRVLQPKDSFPMWWFEFRGWVLQGSGLGTRVRNTSCSDFFPACTVGLTFWSYTKVSGSWFGSLEWK